jgi:hypothetical protein
MAPKKYYAYRVFILNFKHIIEMDTNILQKCFFLNELIADQKGHVNPLGKFLFEGIGPVFRNLFSKKQNYEAGSFS